MVVGSKYFKKLGSDKWMSEEEGKREIKIGDIFKIFIVSNYGFYNAAPDGWHKRITYEESVKIYGKNITGKKNKDTIYVKEWEKVFLPVEIFNGKTWEDGNYFSLKEGDIFRNLHNDSVNQELVLKMKMKTNEENSSFIEEEIEILAKNKKEFENSLNRK